MEHGPFQHFAEKVNVHNCSTVVNHQCTLCGERGHLASRCPDLISPLGEGFQGGGGAGHEHDDNCEDRCVEFNDDAKDLIN